jgi:hypothetical protein
MSIGPTEGIILKIEKKSVMFFCLIGLSCRKGAEQESQTGDDNQDGYPLKNLPSAKYSPIVESHSSASFVDYHSLSVSIFDQPRGAA